jgi:hypothetical protein
MLQLRPDLSESPEGSWDDITLADRGMEFGRTTRREISWYRGCIRTGLSEAGYMGLDELLGELGLGSR